MSEVVIRPLDWQRDYLRAVSVLRELWFDDGNSAIVNEMGARNFFLHYALQGTTMLVACDKDSDEFLGCMILTNKKDTPLLWRSRCQGRKLLRQEKLAMGMLYLWPGAQIYRLFNGRFFDNYVKLRKMLPLNEYGSMPEMLLLIVSNKAQGKGVGRRLMQAAEASLKEQGFASYYLLTDSSCNYKFYDIMQMTKVVDVAMNFGIGHVPQYRHPLNYFLRGLIYRQDLR